ncbi:MAG: hypothetical protein LBF81_04000 [Prevotellaceae bacterium]|jgi:hypothetical protein|nr:hypothetical protein [Prevotellaceae bacterium]
MKKIFFLFAMFANVAASAQNMQITPISATYTSSPVIQFEVSWTGARTYRHNTKVWVFVDYRKVEDNTPAGNWTRAATTATPAVNSTPTSTATRVSGNDKGFWLNGVDGDYSATLTVPLTLAAGVTQFNWCAYATDYPPNVVPHSTSSYTLRGSPPFVLNGTFTTSLSTFSGTITTFTDATGAPGKFPAPLNEKPNEMGCVAGLVENMNGVCVAPSAVGCTNNTLNLGTVSFTAGTEITIVGNGVSQIWSRPVTATGCQKTGFNGGSVGSVNADCRTNPNYAGDFYSGCAAFRYHAQLCPPPWRIPSPFDTKNLAKAFGCAENGNNEVCVKKYVNQWGGEYAGEITASNAIVGEKYIGVIWLNLERGIHPDWNEPAWGVFRFTNDVGSYSGNGLCWWYNNFGWARANWGSLIRCVRDN